jgi:hypothetical protein
VRGSFFCLVPPCGIVSLEFMLSEAEVSKEKERRKIYAKDDGLGPGNY